MNILVVHQDGELQYFDSFAEVEACGDRDEFTAVIVGTDFEVLSGRTDFQAYARSREQKRLDELDRSDSEKGSDLLKSLWHPGRN